MNCYVFSKDRLCFDVLCRSLSEHNFKAPELHPPTVRAVQALEKSFGNCVVFIDLDVPEAVAAVAAVPAGVSLIEFGGHESRALAKRAPALYLRKPFAREQLQRSLHTVLKEIANLPLAPVQKNAATAASGSAPISAVAAAGAANPDLTALWQRKLRLIRDRRDQLRQLLTATPEQMRVLMTPKSANGEPVDVPVSSFPVRMALIVDGDEASGLLAMRSLASKCLLQVDFESSGKAAWEALEGTDPTKPSYDILVMNWELPELSGLGLFNRLRRSARWQHLPIIVTSAKLQATDFRLLAEDLAVSLAPLPLQDKQFTEALVRAVTGGVLAREYLADLFSLVKDSHQAGLTTKTGWQKILEGGDDVVLSALRIAGDEYVNRDEFEAARATYSLAWQMGDRRLSLVTGYAKASLRLGDAEQARRLVGAADALAPHSVERLCLLGASELMLNNFAIAKQNFDEIIAIDPDYQKAQAGKYAASVCLEDSANNPGGRPATTNFAAYLNLVGINLSRTGKLDDAQRYYQSAMHFVYQTSDQAKLWFNMGICHKRAHNKSAAYQAFKQAYDLSGGAMTKALKYLEEHSQSDGAVAPATPATLDYETF